VRRAVAVAVALAVLGAAGALVLRLARAPVSDEDAIRALFADAAAAIAERRVGDAMEAVSPRFAGQGLDRRGLQQLLLGHVLRGAWATAHVAADRVRVDGDSAEAVVLAIAARSGTGTALAELLPANATALRIACRLAREDGAWRVVAAEWREIGLQEALAAPDARPLGAPRDR
jgi:hypothetical protein